MFRFSTSRTTAVILEKVEDSASFPAILLRLRTGASAICIPLFVFVLCTAQLFYTTRVLCLASTRTFLNVELKRDFREMLACHVGPGVDDFSLPRLSYTVLPYPDWLGKAI